MMGDVKIRPSVRDDLARIAEIYNYYVINTPRLICSRSRRSSG
jgi:hypothetical protein